MYAKAHSDLRRIPDHIPHGRPACTADDLDPSRMGEHQREVGTSQSAALGARKERCTICAARGRAAANTLGDEYGQSDFEGAHAPRRVGEGEVGERWPESYKSRVVGAADACGRYRPSLLSIGRTFSVCALFVLSCCWFTYPRACACSYGPSFTRPACSATSCLSLSMR